MKYSIPEEAKPEIVKLREDGMGWTAISRFIDDEYGISLHRTTIQRWHAEFGAEYEVLSSVVDEADDAFIDAKIKLDKKIHSLDADRKLYRRLYLRSIGSENNEDAVLAAIKAFTPALAPQINRRALDIAKATRPKNFGTKTQVMVAPLTDTHVGDNVKSEQILGLNSYDIDLFSRRIWGWANQVLQLAEYRRNMCNIDELVIPMLGDMISGDIHDELSFTNIDNCMMQMIIGAYVLSQAVAFLAPNFKKVKLMGVVGNHGRMTKKIPSKDRYMDWDYMLYQWMATFLRDHTNIEIEIPKAFVHVFPVFDRNILMMHGDSVAGGGSQASIKRAVGNLRDVMQYNGLVETDDRFTVAEKFDDVIMGHFHRIDEMDIGTGSLHICGTTKGGDEYVVSRLHLITRPKHLVLYYHPVHGQVGKETIYLDRFDSQPSEFDTEVPREWSSIGPV
mgnify:CR=1 FL=1